ncbi:stage V sporulation protein AE [Acetivibrio cellulolyticus]|uniref:stage V sporulation protein AE n=1 Tax=Acetivibrio cellulolyticus TaxID=35830 RepID=UPI0001E2E2FD|nr:stage V sporulation protein AE [Acetivibrio cellulolyticus]
MGGNIWTYINAFIVGGVICSAGQILIDKTKLTTARILVIFVTAGAILGSLGVYQKLVEIGGAGATVPLTGFGYNLVKGTFRDVESIGLLGAFTGGVKAAAAGITAAIFFGYLTSVAFNPKAKR